MRIAEILLAKLSRSPGKGDYETRMDHFVPAKELSLLRREFPNFSELVAGSRVMDFGCGDGLQCIALYEQEGCQVWGVDTNPRIIKKAIAAAKAKDINSSVVNFVEQVPEDQHGTFDIVISQNSMEHFPDPESVLEKMKELVDGDGRLLITFGPPWYAPYGSHMHFFCRFPWVNIIFSEETVMAVRKNYRDDGAILYEDVRSGLNKMSVKRFESIVSDCQLDIEFKKYSCVKGMSWLGHIPLLRELFINRISCILRVR